MIADWMSMDVHHGLFILLRLFEVGVSNVKYTLLVSNCKEYCSRNKLNDVRICLHLGEGRFSKTFVIISSLAEILYIIIRL